MCFLLWKFYLGLVWFSFVVARVSFQHLVLHGLLIVFNLKRIIPFFRKQYARKNTNWQNTINASFKSFLYFLISFGCSSLALFCSSSLFLLLFLFKKCFGWDCRSASWYSGEFFVFWQKSRWYRDICSLISSGASSSGFFVVMLVVKLKYHYSFECNYEIMD